MTEHAHAQAETAKPLKCDLGACGSHMVERRGLYAAATTVTHLFSLQLHRARQLPSTSFYLLAGFVSPHR
jgi:hypothetical protein